MNERERALCEGQHNNNERKNRAHDDIQLHCIVIIFKTNKQTKNVKMEWHGTERNGMKKSQEIERVLRGRGMKCYYI